MLSGTFSAHTPPRTHTWRGGIESGTEDRLDHHASTRRVLHGHKSQSSGHDNTTRGAETATRGRQRQRVRLALVGAKAATRRRQMQHVKLHSTATRTSGEQFALMRRRWQHNFNTYIFMSAREGKHHVTRPDSCQAARYWRTGKEGMGRRTSRTHVIGAFGGRALIKTPRPRSPNTTGGHTNRDKRDPRC